MLATLWLLACFFYLGWKGLRWQGLIFVGSVVVMNSVDVTLFYAGVFYPVTLLLAHAAGRSTTRTGSVTWTAHTRR